MSRRLACSLFALVAVAACGDDSGGTKIDSGVIDTRLIDAADPDCDYTEQSDISNDTTSGGASEATGVAFSTRTVVCGTIDHTHFDNDVTIDGDAYDLTVAAETDVVVRMVAPGAAALELVGIDVRDASDGLLGTFSFYGNHGVVSAHLPAGTFTLLVLSLGSEAIITSVPYRIEVVSDTPDTRCPEITVGGFTETETGNNTANDVYDYSGTALPIGAFTAAADVPEETSIVLAPGTDIRFTGDSANVAAADYYEDTDTYKIATGAGTN